MHHAEVLTGTCRRWGVDALTWHGILKRVMGCVAGHMKGLAKRVIACLDVRANDAGDLVVTKGDQYDVRDTDGAGREVRPWSSTRSPFVQPLFELHASGGMRGLIITCA